MVSNKFMFGKLDFKSTEIVNYNKNNVYDKMYLF